LIMSPVVQLSKTCLADGYRRIGVSYSPRSFFEKKEEATALLHRRALNAGLERYLLPWQQAIAPCDDYVEDELEEFKSNQSRANGRAGCVDGKRAGGLASGYGKYKNICVPDEHDKELLGMEAPKTDDRFLKLVEKGTGDVKVALAAHNPADRDPLICQTITTSLRVFDAFMGEAIDYDYSVILCNMISLVYNHLKSYLLCLASTWCSNLISRSLACMEFWKSCDIIIFCRGEIVHRFPSHVFESTKTKPYALAFYRMLIFEIEALKTLHKAGKLILRFASDSILFPHPLHYVPKGGKKTLRVVHYWEFDRAIQECERRIQCWKRR